MLTRIFFLCLLLGVCYGSVTVQLEDDDCNGDIHHYEDNTGQLLSNNYPSSYPPNCEWTVVITTISRDPITLQFQGFSLGQGDSLQIYDNGSSFTETWTKGDSAPTESLVLSNTISIVFISDGSEESSGVKLLWFTDTPPDLPEVVTEALPGTVHNRNVVPGSLGYVRSIGYPDINYLSNTKEHWVLTAPAGSRVAFEFKYFKTESGGDKLKIYSGEDRLTEELIGEYSGNLNYDLPPPLISPSNWVHVYFTSNNFVNYKGFNIEYSIYDPPTAAPTSPPETNSGLDSAVTATIVILLILFSIVVVSLLVYCLWYKPKREAEISEQATGYNKNAEYGNGRAVAGRSSSSRPRTSRPLTAGRPGSSNRPKSVINSEGEVPLAYGSAGRPGTAARPGTAGRPGTAARPDTAGRPGTAGRPVSAAKQEKSEVSRPETGHLRVPIERPGTAKRNYGTETEISQKEGPLAAIVGSNRKPAVDPTLPRIRAPQIMVNDGLGETEDLQRLQAGRLPKGTSRLPPLGGQLAPQGGSSLPPISGHASVPKLELPQESPGRAGGSDLDYDSDEW